MPSFAKSTGPSIGPSIGPSTGPSTGPSSRAEPPLDPLSATPFYRQIYDRVRDAIARGTLRPGDRLPSARGLATQLGTARGTVDAAYEALAGEGYIATRGAGGTIVAPDLRLAAIKGTRPRAAARRRAPAEPPQPGLTATLWPFQLGLPALDAFPRKLWARLATRHAHGFAQADMGYADPAGHVPLREQVARYLAVARGIACDPDQVFITAGYQGALGLITRALLRRGDRTWLEDPGYFLARQAMEAAGSRIVAVPVDDQGMDVAAGIGLAPRARFAVVTPAHQSPLGVALSLPRRRALLAWAAAADAWVIEDDYDSEFRYAGPPLPALKSLDREGRVLYAGTFSKVLFPGLRLGYLVVPDSLLRDFARVCRCLHPDTSGLGAAVVADFLRERHFARHIRRMRTLYAQRRAALATALGEVFGDRFRIDLQAGGMHLLARLDERESDLYLARLAHARGLAPAPLSAMAIKRDGGQGLLLSFTNIPAGQAPAMARKLRSAIEA